MRNFVITIPIDENVEACINEIAYRLYIKDAVSKALIENDPDALFQVFDGMGDPDLGIEYNFGLEITADKPESNDASKGETFDSGGNKAREFAQLLNGREYGSEITKEEEAVAKQNNLVVVYGYSDDLAEFRGAINDETSAWEGRRIGFFNGNLVDLDSDEIEDHKSIFERYGAKFPSSDFVVKVVWCPDDLDTSWIITVEGAEGHHFDIFEDGDLYCRGVVFAMPRVEVG